MEVNRPPIADNVLRIPKGNDFFRSYLSFLKPIHHMTDTEVDMAAAYLSLRQELSKTVLDNNLINKLLQSAEYSKKVREMCHGEDGKPMTSTHFNVLRGHLRAKRFFRDDGTIEPLLIPIIREDTKTFKLLIMFPV